MGELKTLSLILSGALGHAGLVIAAYNRVNATGISRVLIKRIEKGIVLVGAVLPMVLLGLEWRNLSAHGLAGLEELHPLTFAYLIFAGLFAWIAFPMWLLARPRFAQSHKRSLLVSQEVFRPEKQSDAPKIDCFTGKKFAAMGKLPRNEISWTEANRKRLYLDSLPAPLQGLTIAHLSDIHFTGQMSRAYYDRAVKWINDQSPDLIVIAGDIVDYAHAMDRIQDVLGQFHSDARKFFVLGNHDRRLSNPMEVCERLERLEWIDLGKANQRVLLRGVDVELIGNERPWFSRHTLEAQLAREGRGEPTAIRAEADWKLGVAHSPDQFAWGVKNGCGLLLCGHTHGGQIRLPLVGPLVAPSWHGSRFASGTFYRGGTVMHVSRGLSGVHPFRWGCPPEISILELQC